MTAAPSEKLVGRTRFELVTNGLKGATRRFLVRLTQGLQTHARRSRVPCVARERCQELRFSYVGATPCTWTLRRDSAPASPACRPGSGPPAPGPLGSPSTALPGFLARSGGCRCESSASRIFPTPGTGSRGYGGCGPHGDGGLRLASHAVRVGGIRAPGRLPRALINLFPKDHT